MEKTVFEIAEIIDVMALFNYLLMFTYLYNMFISDLQEELSEKVTNLNPSYIEDESGYLFTEYWSFCILRNLPILSKLYICRHNIIYNIFLFSL